MFTTRKSLHKCKKPRSSKKALCQPCKKRLTTASLVPIVFEMMRIDVELCHDNTENYIIFRPHETVERQHALFVTENVLREFPQLHPQIFHMNFTESARRQLDGGDAKHRKLVSKFPKRILTSPCLDFPQSSEASNPITRSLLSDVGLERSSISTSARKIFSAWVWSRKSPLNEHGTVWVRLTPTKSLEDPSCLDIKINNQTKYLQNDLKDPPRDSSTSMDWICLRRELKSVFGTADFALASSLGTCVHFFPLLWSEDDLSNITIDSALYGCFRPLHT